MMTEHPPNDGFQGTTPRPLTPAAQELLEDWRRMALKASRRHSSACDSFERRDSSYGLVSTALTAIVGSTIFVTLQKTTSETVRIAFGLIAACAAIASGIQTTAKYGQRAERHRQASRHYATVARMIDELLANPPAPGEIKATLDELRKSLDDTGAMAPNVPPKIWNTTDDGDQRIHFRSHRPLPGEQPTADSAPGEDNSRDPN